MREACGSRAARVPTYSPARCLFWRTPLRAEGRSAPAGGLVTAPPRPAAAGDVLGEGWLAHALHQALLFHVCKLCDADRTVSARMPRVQDGVVLAITRRDSLPVEPLHVRGLGRAGEKRARGRAGSWRVARLRAYTYRG